MHYGRYASIPPCSGSGPLLNHLILDLNLRSTSPSIYSALAQATRNAAKRDHAINYRHVPLTELDVTFLEATMLPLTLLTFTCPGPQPWVVT